MRVNDGTRPFTPRCGTQLIEYGAIEQDGMAVTYAHRRPHDRRPRALPRVYNLSDSGRIHERDIDRDDERRLNIGRHGVQADQ